jgi:hypothetical protein
MKYLQGENWQGELSQQGPCYQDWTGADYIGLPHVNGTAYASKDHMAAKKGEPLVANKRPNEWHAKQDFVMELNDGPWQQIA